MLISIVDLLITELEIHVPPPISFLTDKHKIRMLTNSPLKMRWILSFASLQKYKLLSCAAKCIQSNNIYNQIINIAIIELT